LEGSSPTAIQVEVVGIQFQWYIAVLPGMGITSSLLANFSRRFVLGYPMMSATTVLIGLLGLVVLGHHMLVSGMNPYAGTACALTAMGIAVPSSAKVLSWLGMLLGGRGKSLRQSDLERLPWPSCPCQFLAGRRQGLGAAAKDWAQPPRIGRSCQGLGAAAGWAQPLENSQEFSTSTTTPRASESKRKGYGGPYEYGIRPDGLDFIMQCHSNTKPE
jgi:hypothetical protein